MRNEILMALRDELIECARARLVPFLDYSTDYYQGCVAGLDLAATLSSSAEFASRARTLQRQLDEMDEEAPQPVVDYVQGCLSRVRGVGAQLAALEESLFSDGD